MLNRDDLINDWAQKNGDLFNHLFVLSTFGKLVVLL